LTRLIFGERLYTFMCGKRRNKMKPLTEVLSIYKRNFSTGLDVGDHLKDGFVKLVESKKFYPYSENIKDKIDRHIVGWEYGDTEHNRLWMKLLNEKNGNEFYGFVDSPILYPTMIDRCFFIDVMDRQATNELYDIMELMYKEELNCTWEGPKQ
jgi:hypothetical protein